MLLTPGIPYRLKNEDLSGIDYVFSWLGSTNILLPIINLIEDKLNVEEDSKYEGVQSILMVENSIRMSSIHLRHLYKIILEQSREYMTEGLNEHQKMMQMRGRPKDPACQQAMKKRRTLFEKHKSQLLGVITDVDHNPDGTDGKGIIEDFFKQIKEYDPAIPILIQSADAENEKFAEEYGNGFLNNNSRTYPLELKALLKKYFYFGDFIFTDP